MKVLRKISLLILAPLALFTACEDGDKVFDQIVEAEERGAVLRTVNLISNELPIGVAGSGFAAELEVQDQEDGALLESLDVYVGFRDNTVPDGGTDLDVAEALFSNIPSSSFSIGEFGFPRTTVEIGLDEMLAFTGVTEADLFGGDQFTVRFELNLTDGRSFSNDDNSGTLTGSFFASPFLYTPTVVCPVGAEQFVGTYVISDVTGGVFGTVWGDGTVVELSVGETSTQRQFDAVYLPQFGIGNGPATFAFDLVCGGVNVPGGQGSGLTCGNGGITFGPPVAAAIGSYDPADDSSFTITFREDEIDDCGGGADVTVTLTKQ